jgi:hypothetical protein
MIDRADALPALAAGSPEERAALLRRPIAAVMRPPVVVVRPERTPEEIGRLCAEYRVDLAPVVDAEGYCLGVVLASDLLLPDLPPPRPARIGGMATPFGVYLTDGTLQAGAGNGALVASGALLGAYIVLGYGIVYGGLWLAVRWAHLPNSPIFNPLADLPANAPWPGLAATALQTLGLILFLLLMRFTRLAGYHAAEHQTVHAVERDEPLTPDVVRRMPRAHPRCGTNLMAAGILFFTLQQALNYVPFLGEAAPILALLTTVFIWRPVGTFLQEKLTTRPASDRELASGIAAGEALLEKYRHSPPARPRFLRRLWCMGLLQTALGMMAVTGSVLLIIRAFGAG